MSVSGTGIAKLRSVWVYSSGYIFRFVSPSERRAGSIWFHCSLAQEIRSLTKAARFITIVPSGQQVEEEQAEQELVE